MQVTDRLIQQQNRAIREKIRRREDQQPEFQDEEEGYYMYLDHSPMEPINTGKSVFDRKDDTSINTAPSVFDRTAIFHTNTDYTRST